MLSFSDVVSLQTRVSVLNCPVYCSGFGVPKFTGHCLRNSNLLNHGPDFSVISSMNNLRFVCVLYNCEPVKIFLIPL